LGGRGGLGALRLGADEGVRPYMFAFPTNVAKDATLEWGTLILLLLNTKQNMFPHSRFNVRDVMTFIS
jgi:hypothetical protein